MTQQFEWLNETSRTFLQRDYLEEGQSAEQRIRDICDNAQKILLELCHEQGSNDAERLSWLEGFSDRMYDYMGRGYISFSTPVWINFGNERGLPVSCFNSYIDDTVDDILEKAKEVGVMSKMGGGTSGYLGAIRPRGAKIKNGSGGLADGPVRFLQLYAKVVDIISQGSSRRGSFAAYLPIDHPDIMEFLQLREPGNPMQEMNFAVTISDEWMESLQMELAKGVLDKFEILCYVIKRRYNSGFPYILFSGNANKQKPQVYKDKGYEIVSSNLCVAGNQRVVSNRGILTAKDLYEEGGDLVLFDNNRRVSASPMRLVEKDAPLLKVTLDNGMSHTVTPYHKIQLKDGSCKRADEITLDDCVSIQTNKGLFGLSDMAKEAFLLGLYQSDGTQSGETIHLDLWEPDFDLEEEIQSSFNEIHNKYGCGSYEIVNQFGSTGKKRERKPAKFVECQTGDSAVRKKRLASKTLSKALNFSKGFVPDWVWESNEETQWQYVRGLLYADGTVFKSSSRGEPIQISYADINKEFLEELQILFANLGLQSSIRVLREAGTTLLPNHKGGKSEYQAKACYRLIVGNKPDALEIEKNTGFLTRKGVFVEDRDYRDNTKKAYKVKSVERVGNEDVYCCTVNSDEHLWVCNGFITHNCNEIMLPSTPDESFVCVLSSLNLRHWDTMKETDVVEVLTYFLDAVNEEFVRKASKINGMERAARFARRHRALGLGALGWHSYLQENMIPWETMEAKFKNLEIWETIRERADWASEQMASDFGEPEVLKGYGRRNTTTLAVAPTSSSSTILGQMSPGIEPYICNYYVNNSPKGTFTFRNPYFEKLLDEKGKNTAIVWDSVLKKDGSVQHLNFLSDEEKEVFKTWEEISQKDIIIQASQRQKFIDQGQSLNLMVHPYAPAHEIVYLIFDAWKLGAKGLYYQRSGNPAQKLSQSLSECKACQ